VSEVSKPFYETDKFYDAVWLELKDGTSVKVTDTGITTFYKKRMRHYDWKDLRIMNDALTRIAGMRGKKK
jgi:hypothetical protein